MFHYRNEPLPYVCPYCQADFSSEFALFKHFNVCQAIIGKTEPEE